MDQVQKARTRLAEIEQEAEKLRAFVEAWDAVADILGDDAANTVMRVNSDEADAESPPVAVLDSVPALESPKRTRVTDNPKASVLIPAAIEILRESGHPMTRRELHDALSARGLVVRGSDPIKALGTILWRANDHLIQLEGVGYWPKGDAYHPAGYYAGL